MRDFDIRQALLYQLRARFSLDPDTRIIEELGLCQGSVRIDIAVANCALHGYEIKSAVDTLQRLPAQAAAYSLTFDHVSIVTANCHLEPLLKIIPEWWGIIGATERAGAIRLEDLRRAEQNPKVDSYSVAQLLWRDEALRLLEQLGFAKGVRSKPREYLWKRLAEVADSDCLRQCVRDRLKTRECWRVDAPPA